MGGVIAISFLTSNLLLAQANTPMIFAKDEITSSMTATLEKTSHGQYRLRNLSKPLVPNSNKIKRQLERELRHFEELRIIARSKLDDHASPRV